jgi:hypothetical protein
MVCIYHTATWMSLSVSCALYGNFLYVEFSNAVRQRVGRLPAMADPAAGVPCPSRPGHGVIRYLYLFFDDIDGLMGRQGE